MILLTKSASYSTFSILHPLSGLFVFLRIFLICESAVLIFNGLLEVFAFFIGQPLELINSSFIFAISVLVASRLWCVERDSLLFLAACFICIFLWGLGGFLLFFEVSSGSLFSGLQLVSIKRASAAVIWSRVSCCWACCLERGTRIQELRDVAMACRKLSKEARRILIKVLGGKEAMT